MKKDVLAEGIGYIIILVGIVGSFIAGNVLKL